MTRRRVATGLCALLLAPLIAGCIGSASESVDEADAGAAVDGAADAPVDETGAESDGKEADAARGLVKRVVYAHEDAFTGTDPPSLLGAGEAFDGKPVHEDAFTVPADAERVVVEVDLHSGPGMGRVDIVDADGRVAWSSGNEYCVGAAGVYSGCVIHGDTRKDAPLTAGDYTILYRVAGAMSVVVEVAALVPAASADA